MTDKHSLPVGWVWTRVGEVCLNPQYGWTTSATNAGTLHLLRTTDITSGGIDWDSVPFCKKEPPEKEKYLLKDGDMVISRAGSVGYSHLIKNPKEAVFASYLIRFRPLIDEHYLAYFLKSPSYWGSISEKSLGIAIPNVNASKLKQITIPIPPLPEQHHIVAKIEELFTKLDAGVKVLNKVKSQLKRYRQAVLKHAFEGKLTEEWREAHKGEIGHASMLLERIKEVRRKNAKGKYRELPPVDTSNLPELPEGWVWTRVGEVTLPSKERYNPFDSRKEIFIGLEHIEGQTGKILARGNSSQIRSTKTKFYKGDILYGRLRPYLNKVCVPEFDGICSTDILVFPKSRFIESKYLAQLLSKNEFVRYATQNMSGVQHPRVNFEILSQYIVPLPPLPEQHKIVEEIERRLSAADGVEKVVEQSLKRAERLRQSILKEAFEGKLVPQDPSDEPAEKLLERIKAEKEKREAVGKEKRRKRTRKRRS